MWDYIPLLFKGALLTLEVAIVSLVIACILGIIFAFFKISNVRLLRLLGYIYSSITRGIPELVLMLMIYYGGQIMLNNLLELFDFGHLRINLSSFFVGTLTIGFIYGAYLSETFRGAMMAIEKGQIEAGESFAFTKRDLFFHIIFPQMIRHGLASFTNNWLVLLKTVSLVSLIGLHDIVFYSNLGSTTTKQPFSFYFMLSIFFLLCTSVSLYILDKLKNRYHFETSEG